MWWEAWCCYDIALPLQRPLPHSDVSIAIVNCEVLVCSDWVTLLNVFVVDWAAGLLLGEVLVLLLPGHCRWPTCQSPRELHSRHCRHIRGECSWGLLDWVMPKVVCCNVHTYVPTRSSSFDQWQFLTYCLPRGSC